MKNKKNQIDEAVERMSNEEKKTNENSKQEQKGSNLNDKPKDLNKENKITKEQEYLQALQHNQAEFENYRKRVDRDREIFAKFASESLVKKLLPSLDNFERCLANASEQNHKEFVEGIKMVHDQIWKELNSAGVKRINAEDTPFNPELHEPLLQEESDKPANTVLQVLEAGYTLNGKVLRHARVKISKEKSK
jgi:molecular chaperone GrpE